MRLRSILSRLSRQPAAAPVSAGECRLSPPEVLAIAGRAVPRYASRLHVATIERTDTGPNWVVCTEGLGHLPIIRIDDATGTTVSVEFWGQR